MVEEVFPEPVMRDVWRRDDFTCRSCGRIVLWEDLRVVRSVGPDGLPIDGPDGLMSVCAACMEDGRIAPSIENGDRRLLQLKHAIEELAAPDDAMVLDKDRRSGKLTLERKVSELVEENRRLLTELNDKTALAIAYKKKMDRALQDLENYKKRSENEIALKVRDRTKAIALAAMTTLEDLDRALKDSERRLSDPKAHSNLLTGLKGIRKALVSQLSTGGIEVIEPLGRPFDPGFHEAVGSVEDKAVRSDTVVLVISPGCILDGKVLRPARVMVSKGGPKKVGPAQPREGGGEVEAAPPTEEMECTEEVDWGELEDGSGQIEGQGPIPIGPAEPASLDEVKVGKLRPKRCRRKAI